MEHICALVSHYKCDGHTVVPWFINAFVCEQFGSQTEHLEKFCFCLHILHWVTNVTAAIFPE